MQKLFYTIYKTTCLVNGKVYYGKHITTDLDDAYLGSGKLLTRAIKKHGVENFKKEILFIFDTEKEMNKKEKELVTEDFVLKDTNYNLCVGGQGGWSYVNRLGKGVPHFSKTNAKDYAAKGNEALKEKRAKDQAWAKECNKKVSESLKKHFSTNPGTFIGRVHSEETKKKMSKSSKGKVAGTKNGQYGTRWITNETENKKIKKTDPIPDGWRLGRKIKV